MLENIKPTVSDPVPLAVYGEGNYALTDIKEIKVTDEFLSLGSDITKCKEQQYKADCEASQYLEKVSSICGCAPLQLKHFFTEEVRDSRAQGIEKIIKEN